jgi:hypothetical protein
MPIVPVLSLPMIQPELDAQICIANRLPVNTQLLNNVSGFLRLCRPAPGPWYSQEPLRTVTQTRCCTPIQTSPLTDDDGCRLPNNESCCCVAVIKDDG